MPSSLSWKTGVGFHTYSFQSTHHKYGGNLAQFSKKKIKFRTEWILYPLPIHSATPIKPNFTVKSVISKPVGILSSRVRLGLSGKQEAQRGQCKGSFNIFSEKSQLVCGFDLLLITSSLNQNWWIGIRTRVQKEHQGAFQNANQRMNSLLWVAIILSLGTRR